MPNGFHGPEEEWKRIEAPLHAIDPEIAAFAERNGLRVSRNRHHWPERSLRWGGGIERVIQIYLADEERLSFHVWLCAFEDRGRTRFWRRRFLREGISIDEIRADLDTLLESGKAEVDSWTSDDLEYAGPLAGGEGGRPG